jgi:environmental stress-induced protein Ves
MSLDRSRVIRAAEHRLVPWRNGRGTTLELAVDPPGAALGAGLRWRLSAAPVTEDGPFSVFPGLARTLVLLEGPALVLEVNGQEVVLDRPHAVARFPGDVPTRGRVPLGPIRDLNWMVDATVPHHGEVARGEGSLPAGPGRAWVVAPLDAPALVGGVALAPLEVCVLPEGEWRAEGAVFVGRIGG